MSLLVCGITFAASGAPLPFQPGAFQPEAAASSHGVEIAASFIPH